MADNLPLSSADVTESGSLNLPEPSGPHRPVMGLIHFIMSVDCATIAVKLQSWHSQLTLHARNIPSAVCWAPPEDEQIMLETCTDPWFSINWMKSASRWFHYTDALNIYQSTHHKSIIGLHFADCSVEWPLQVFIMNKWLIGTSINDEWS
jgi:hypothetical protein